MTDVTDPRWQELAAVLVDYSTKTRAGDRVLIAMIEPHTFALARAVYSHAVRAGAFPQVQFSSALMDRELTLLGSDEQIGWVPELDEQGMKWADVYIGLRGAVNPFESSGIVASRLALRKRAIGVISSIRNESTRWVIIRVPNESFAQQAEVGIDEMMSFFFQATIKDWSSEAARANRLLTVFEAAERVQILGQGTDISFSTAGRKYLVGDGAHNMPDGEIYTAPVEDSVDGEITFEFPGVYGDRRIEGIRVKFESGRVRSATANKNEDLLQEIIATDEGASRLGEFGVGTNYGITRFVGDLLYDEKIGGTIHLALGRSYTECGGQNDSAVHWDIIKDLRQQGSILLDGRKVFQDGAWLVDW